MVAQQGVRTRTRQVRHVRRKVQMCLWLLPETLARVQAQARQGKVPVSELIERYIRSGLEEQAAVQMEAAALPLLTQTIQAVLEDHARHVEERLAKLLARNVLIGDTTRRLL